MKCPEGGECQFTPDYEHDGIVSCEKCGRSEDPPSEMELAFRLIESAVDAHPKLFRVDGAAGQPKVTIGRLGVSICIPVKLWGSGKVSEVRGEGSDMSKAATDLVARLHELGACWRE